MKTTIKLERGTWTLDDSQRLGPPGGFGEVFRGTGPEGDVAIKRLKLTADAAAHREMKISKVLAGRTLEHVVPVRDFGQDADTDRYYLVMPVCDYSLQDAINKAGNLPWDEAKTAALHTIAGLEEVGDLVHRDLKPGNVLWHRDRWRVADFGIAKFVADSTSLETMRDALSPPYAAPEQWLGEPPTRATDVYALGCMIHAMVNGAPPFGGDLDAIRKAHLNSNPPDLRGVDPRLDSLVRIMMRKSNESRPSLKRCSTVIEGIAAQPARKFNQALAQAGNIIAQEEAAAEAKRRAEETAKRERSAMANEAIREFKENIKRLFAEIKSDAESAQVAERAIVLGPAHLTVGEATSLSSGQMDGWDIAAFSSLSLRASLNRVSEHQPAIYTFPASIFYCRTPDDREFRWREMSFWSLGSNSNYDRPVLLTPMAHEFQLVISRALTGWQFAHGPMPIDAEDEDAFRERWVNLFTKAASRQLHPSSNMPIQPSYFQ
jgi:serine/threonine-protein kinase